MNILVYFLILLLSLITIYISYKKLDKLGLVISFIMMSLLSFILSFKYITISTLTINANAITYISMFSILYLYLEKTNKKETRKLINLNITINIIVVSLLILMSLYTQSLDDTVGINMKNVFLDNYRILIAYPIAQGISLHSIVIMYNKVKEIYDNMFITTTVTFLLVGLIDLIIFNCISYLFVLDIKAIIELILSTYMLKIILTVIYSFFLMQISKKKKVKRWMPYIY